MIVVIIIIPPMIQGFFFQRDVCISTGSSKIFTNTVSKPDQREAFHSKKNRKLKVTYDFYNIYFISTNG